MICLTSGGLAEQHGNAIAEGCLRDMLAAPDQAARGDILRSALLRLQCLPHPKRATGGFTTTMVNVIERGLGIAK
jgi:hypothetical protein